MKTTFELAKASDSLVVKDIAEWRESPNVDHRPDIGIYPTNEQAEAAYSMDGEESRVHEARKPFMARVAWAWLVSFGEIKYDPDGSAFLLPPVRDSKFLRMTDGGEAARAQVTSFATELMYRQHRTHLLTFYVTKTFARLMRWDRTGLIVTEPIDLRVPSGRKTFLNFFYWMAQMSLKELGYDETAALASAEEAQLMKEYEPPHPSLKEMLSVAVSKPHEYPIYKVCALSVE